MRCGLQSDKVKIEDFIHSTFCKLLNLDTFCEDERFSQLGGNSLKIILLVSDIKSELGVELTTEEIYKNDSFLSLCNLINSRLKQAIAKSDNKSKTDKDELDSDHERRCFPPTANWYSYFLKREDWLYWNIRSPIWKLNCKVNLVTLETTVNKLVRDYDALRLRIGESNNELYQYIEVPSKCKSLVVENINVKAFEDETDKINTLLEKYENSFNYDAELFKVVLVVSNDVKGSSSQRFLFMLSHHLLMDGVSFNTVAKTLLDSLSGNDNPQNSTNSKTEQRKTENATSFYNYCCEYQNYMQAHEQRLAKKWEAIDFSSIRSIAISNSDKEKYNREKYSVKVSTKIPLQAYKHIQDPGLQIVYSLSAIARGFSLWTQQENMLAALVSHGRETFSSKVDLSRSVGWISDTVPVIVQGDGDVSKTIEDVKKAIYQTQVFGKSYNYLKYLSKNTKIRDQFSCYPEQDLSINIRFREDFNSTDNFEVTTRFNETLWNKETAKRVYLISSGIVFGADGVIISFDYSSKLFSEQEMYKLLNNCVVEFETIVNGVV